METLYMGEHINTPPGELSTPQSYALAYIQHPLNWRLCQLRPNSKAPVLTEWNSPARAISDPIIAAQTWRPNDASGIGLVHESSHTGAFDVDSLEWARYTLEDFGFDLDQLLEGYPRIKGREGRDKIIFSVPEALATCKLVWPKQTEAGKPVTVFELRGKGGQDVLPPSIHPDTGAPYEWIVSPFGFPEGVPSIPATLLTLWKHWADFKPQLEAACPWRVEVKREYRERKRSAAGSDANVIGAFNEANSVRNLLEAHGYRRKGKRWLSPTSSSGIPGVNIFLNDAGKERCFSHHASDPLNDGYAHDAFDVFCTLEHGGNATEAVKAAADQLGLYLFQAPPVAVDFSGLVSQKPAATPSTAPATPRKGKTPDDYSFPAHLLNVPGLVGEIAGHIGRTAIYPQPVLELGAALAFCGTIMGRKIRTETNLRTNLYALGVAYSGSGKEHARKTLKRLAVEAAAEEFIGAEKVASDAGLFDLLATQPATLWLADEFGRVLKAMTDRRAPSYLAALSTQIMELSGSADSYLVESRKAGLGSERRPVRIVHQPNLCIYGTTVPGRLFQSLTPEDIQDGFLPRWLLFESDTPDPIAKAPEAADPAGIIEAIQAWRDRSATPEGFGNLMEIAPPEPTIFRATQPAVAAFREWGERWRGRKITHRQNGLDAMWARAAEHAQRLALIRSAGEHPDEPEISENSAAWACEIIDFLLMRSSRQALECIAASEHDGHGNRIAQYIRENSPVRMGDLTYKFKHLKKNDRQDLIGVLVESGRVEVEREETGAPGRPSFILNWTGEP